MPGNELVEHGVHGVGFRLPFPRRLCPLGFPLCNGITGIGNLARPLLRNSAGLLSGECLAVNAKRQPALLASFLVAVAIAIRGLPAVETAHNKSLDLLIVQHLAGLKRIYFPLCDLALHPRLRAHRKVKWSMCTLYAHSHG